MDTKSVFTKLFVPFQFQGRKNSFLSMTWEYFIVFRFFGLMPFAVTKNGKIQTSLFWMIYSVVVFAVAITFVIHAHILMNNHLNVYNHSMILKFTHFQTWVLSLTAFLGWCNSLTKINTFIQVRIINSDKKDDKQI